VPSILFLNEKLLLWNFALFQIINIAFVFLGQGSVEGLAYEAVNNMLYWTCNNDATISRINLTNNETKVEQVITLESNDKPRGIDVDSCNMYVHVFISLFMMADVCKMQQNLCMRDICLTKISLQSHSHAFS
jgi:hypothetical protein